MRTIVSLAALAAALVTATPAMAKEGDLLVRLRGILVEPTGQSDGVTPTFPTGKVKAGDAVVPELDFTYMVSNHIGTELILATSKHTAKGRDALNGVDPLASTWVLPPTLTVQYHFLPEAKIRPYVGAGINYTIFYNTKAGSDLVAAVGSTKVKMKDSVGYALQAGVDVDLNKKFFLNLDVKYVDMDPKTVLTTGALVNTTRVHIDPLIIGVGIGTRF